jgi:DNA-binding transcriptional LysR family regulator
MQVTLNQLLAFERIMRLGSFRRASEALGLTQPSVSQRIQELETALQTRLFVRTGTRARPTAEAHALLAYADRMLGVTNEMHDRFRSRDPLRGVVRIGMSENFALVGLIDLLQRLRLRYPALQISLYVGDSGHLTQRLNRRELDVALVAEPAMESHVDEVPVGVSRLLWFAAAPWALPADPMTPRQLARHHLMIAPPSARMHGTVTRWFQEGGANPERISTCNNVAVTRLAILGGLVIGLLPARIMAPDVAAGAVKIVAVTPPVRPHRVSICYQTSEWGPPLREFVELTRSIIAEIGIFEPAPPAPPAGTRGRT